MPLSGMIKLKLKFLKNTQNKITKSIFYFPFILELKKKEKEKRLHDTKTVQPRENGKRRKKKKEEKRKYKKKID